MTHSSRIYAALAPVGPESPSLRALNQHQDTDYDKYERPPLTEERTNFWNPTRFDSRKRAPTMIKSRAQVRVLLSISDAQAAAHTGTAEPRGRYRRSTERWPAA